MSVDQSSWESAVQHLYEDAFAYIATGPRRHSDWRTDVLAVMARAVPDPRGWIGLDGDAHDPERTVRPAYPFRPLTPETLAERLLEIDCASAEDLLLALTDDCCSLENLWHFTESVDELRQMARTILSRYGDAFTCHTNLTSGRATGILDLKAPGQSWRPMSVYSEDTGLVIVSDTEVGLFWNFADY